MKLQSITLLTTFICLCFIDNCFIISNANSAISQPDYFAVVNAQNPIKEISIQELKKIYLGDSINWKNNDKLIMPAIYEDIDEKEFKFINEILDFSAAAYRSYWRKKVFTGEGIPPKKYTHNDEVIDYVKHNKGAIGIVTTNKINNNPDLKYVSIINQ